MNDLLIKENLNVEYILVNKNGKCPDEIKTLEDMDWNENKPVTNKIKADSDGEWNCIIGMINRKYFDSREALDRLFVAIESVDRSREKQFQQISLKQALEYLNVRISCNMDYYLSNKKELEKDLNRQIDYLDLNDEIILKKLEAELFFKQMCELFGEQNEAKNHDETPEMCGDETKLFLQKYTQSLEGFSRPRRKYLLKSNSLWSSIEEKALEETKKIEKSSKLK
jgi:hypothetical protein